MLFTAFPLRLRGSFLERCDQASAVLSLIEMMARTPNGSWSGCPHFGLREYFEFARIRPELPQAAVRQANLALEDLGITGFRIQSIESEESGVTGADRYVVRLTAPGQKTYGHVFELRR